MDGILIIDKPAGITSHDVVARVRRILRTRRVGHTGTLDPFATGVMVVLVGKATRLAQFVDKDEKEYEATLQFGWETDSGDLTGEPKGSKTPDDEVEKTLSEMNWNDLLAGFRGRSMQTPPMFSAKKIDGKKLYELARQNVEIERKPVEIEVRELELLSLEGSRAKIRVACSAGTYVRTLAEDLGRKIGTGAHLVELRRTRAGDFRIEEATTLERLAEHDDPAAILRPMTDAVRSLRSIHLSSERAEKTRSGLSSFVDEVFDDGEPVRMIDDESKLIAIGVYDAKAKSVKPKIVLV